MKRMTWALAALVGLGLFTTTAVANAENKVPVRTAQLSPDNNTQIDTVNYRYGRGYYGRGYYGYRGYPRYYGYGGYYGRPYYGYRSYYRPYYRPYYYGYRPYYGYGSGVYLRF